MSTERLPSSGPEPFGACPDGGRCWHGCPLTAALPAAAPNEHTGYPEGAGFPCWRVLHAEPFSYAYPDTPDGRWPADLVARHQEASSPAPGPERVHEVLAHIRRRQAEPGGTGNPEGHTEMHTYHVWEALNALMELADE